MPEAEIEAVLDNIRTQEEKMGVAAGEGVTAVSLHSVKADDSDRNTATGSVGAEVGFLQLMESADAPPAGFLESGAPGAKSVDGFDVGEVTVRVLRNDDTPQSRFTYVWVRHGVMGAFDGATRPETEQWVRAYLAEPVLVGAEDAALAAAAVPVPGYAYANADLGDTTDLLVTDPVGDVPSSFHVVVDRDGTIGKLLLVKPGRPLTSEELAAAEASSISAVRADATVIDTTDHGGVAVSHLRSSEADYYVWVQGEVAAVYLTTEHPDAAVPFIDAYLAAG